MPTPHHPTCRPPRRTLYPLVIASVLTLLGTLAQANEPPAFGVITSVTGSSQFVIDIKSSADAQPERNQRIINVQKSLKEGRVIELNLTTENPNPVL